MSVNQEKFEQWAIVELMGHVRIAGRVSEEERFGSKVGRIDVPDGDQFFTQYFGGSSVYRLTIVSEEVARSVASASTTLPIRQWELPKPALTSPVPSPARHEWEDEDEQEDDDETEDDRDEEF